MEFLVEKKLLQIRSRNSGSKARIFKRQACMTIYIYASLGHTRANIIGLKHSYLLLLLLTGGDYYRFRTVWITPKA